MSQIEDGYDRASIITAIAPYLPAKASKDINKSISQALHDITDGYDKASAIRILTPLLTHDNHASIMRMPSSSEAIRRGLDFALSIQQQRLRLDLLRQGIDLWMEMGHKQETYALWRRIIWQLRTASCADVLLCLSELKPLIREIADESVLKHIAQRVSLS